VVCVGVRPRPSRRRGKVARSLFDAVECHQLRPGRQLRFSLGGGGDDNAQVVQDVRQVAIAVLANKRRRAISGGAEVKVTVSTLFLTTASYTRGLIKQVAFINRVKRMMNNDAVRLEARGVITEECALRGHRGVCNCGN